MQKSKLNKQFDKQFALFVKAKRIAKGWSQAKLADEVDNNYQNISRLERGEITPTIFWCYKLADVFGIALEDFLKEFGFKIKK